MQATRPLLCRPAGTASSACSTSGSHQRTSLYTPRHCRSRGLSVSVHASVRARWVIDVRYGHKAEAVALMQEWVQVIGSRAGLTAANTRLSSGAVGAPESRVELEVTLGSVSDWEAMLAAIPGKEHRAWSERAMPRIVDGSPRWELYRAIPVGLLPEDGVTAETAVLRPAASAKPPPARSLQLPPPSTAGNSSSTIGQSRPSGLTIVEGADTAAVILEASRTGTSSAPTPNSTEGDEPIMRDWKGDPLKLNPGDKLPGMKFL